MAICERSEYCGFFNNRLADMPTLAHTLKDMYCHKNKHRCARYMVHKKLRQGFAPADETALLSIERQMDNLYPDDTAGARQIIKMLQQQ